MALSDTVARGPDALRAPAKAAKLRLDGMALHARWLGAGAPQPPLAGRPAPGCLLDGLGIAAAGRVFPARVPAPPVARRGRPPPRQPPHSRPKMRHFPTTCDSFSVERHDFSMVLAKSRPEPCLFLYSNPSRPL